ncbi:MAG: transcriptional regulator NrdR [Halobacteriaceae archaeon]
MRCPDCGEGTSRVVDSQPINEAGAIRRRRECKECGFRFTTYERTEWDLQVQKSDGSIEPFSREKLRAGIERAVEKRPVTDQQIADLVDGIESDLQDTDSRIVDSTDIGDRVSERLHDLDTVAYLRFVSVYRAFSDPEEFRRELDEVIEDREP